MRRAIYVGLVLLATAAIGGDVRADGSDAVRIIGGVIGNDLVRVSAQSSGKLPTGCAPGQVPLWNGSVWVCGTVGGGGIARLEDLQGLPCNGGAETGTVSLAINPVSHAVSLSCPRIGQFQLDVAVGGPGEVTGIPADIDCGSGLGACSHGYNGGAIVTLTESHEADVASFAGWTGACSGTDATCQVTMDQARQVGAIFFPTLSLSVVTGPSVRDFSCTFGICFRFDRFTDSLARVTVRDLDTGAVVGTCDADTTLVVSVTEFSPPSVNTTTCHMPVQPGHHLSLEAQDSSTLGGTQEFAGWFNGGCAGSTNPVCQPAAAVTVHEEVAAAFQ